MVHGRAKRSRARASEINGLSSVRRGPKGIARCSQGACATNIAKVLSTSGAGSPRRIRRVSRISWSLEIRFSYDRLRRVYLDTQQPGSSIIVAQLDCTTQSMRLSSYVPRSRNCPFARPRADLPRELLAPRRTQPEPSGNRAGAAFSSAHLRAVVAGESRLSGLRPSRARAAR